MDATQPPTPPDNQDDPIHDEDMTSAFLEAPPGPDDPFSVPFPGHILVRKHVQAVQCATNASRVNAQHLVLWTDASVAQARALGSHIMPSPPAVAAAAVVFKKPLATPPSPWQQAAFCVSGYTDVDEVELVAVKTAIEIAHTRLAGMSSEEHRPGTVSIFTDSQIALHIISKKSRGENVVEAVDRIHDVAHQLRSLGIHIELHWVPARRVPGNIKADTLARRARHFAESSKGDHFTGSLTAWPIQVPDVQTRDTQLLNVDSNENGEEEEGEGVLRRVERLLILDSNIQEHQNWPALLAIMLRISDEILKMDSRIARGEQD